MLAWNEIRKIRRNLISGAKTTVNTFMQLSQLPILIHVLVQYCEADTSYELIFVKNYIVLKLIQHDLSSPFILILVLTVIMACEPLSSVLVVGGCGFLGYEIVSLLGNEPNCSVCLESQSGSAARYWCSLLPVRYH